MNQSLFLRSLVFLLFIPSLVFADYFKQVVEASGSLVNSEPGEEFFLRVSTPEGIHRVRLRRIDTPRPKVSVNGQVVKQTQQDDLLLFKGKVLSKKNRRSPLDGVAGSIYKGRLTLDFYGHRKHIFRVVKNLRSTKRARLTHAPRYLKLGCGSGTTASMVSQISKDFAVAEPIFSPTYIVSLGTEADFEFYQQNSSSVSTANAAIKQFVNSVNSIYTSQIGLTFEVSSQNVFTNSSQPYTSSDADTLLSDFRTYTISNKHISGDLKHLFSGKNFTADGSSGVVGLAFLGVLCNAPNFSYGITESRTPLLSLVHLIAAHEIGHNLDANHTSAGLMQAVLDTSSQFLSNFSINEINTHVNANNSCLSTASSVSLRVKRFKKKFRAIVTPAVDMSACTINLYGANKKNKLSGDYSNAKLLHSFAGGPVDVQIKQLAKKVNRRPSKNTFFQAVAVCSSETHTSDKKKVKAEAGDGTIVPVRLFLKQLKKKYS